MANKVHKKATKLVKPSPTESATKVLEEPCEFCGTTQGVSFGPDAYNSDINGDPTPVWSCSECQNQRADDI